MALFTLGPITFKAGGVNLDGIAIQENWRHNFQEAIKGKGSRSYTGKQVNSITITGVVFPGQYGDENALTIIRQMANAGEARQLLDGSGQFQGRYVIASLGHERVQMFDDGTPRQVSYTIELIEDPNGV